jgi:hypothetical protein
MKEPVFPGCGKDSDHRLNPGHIRTEGREQRRRNMKKKLMEFACTALLAFASAQLCAGVQPGVTDTRFNRRFLPTLKPMMTYEQIVRIVGAPGVKVGEDRKSSPPTVQYSWNGGKGSVLTVRLGNNRMIDATVQAPNRNIYLIKSNGQIVESSH